MKFSFAINTLQAIYIDMYAYLVSWESKCSKNFKRIFTHVFSVKSGTASVIHSTRILIYMRSVLEGNA
jgi:hypothetical protein